MKQCNKCGERKPYDCFHVDKAKKDGLRRECKECSIARVRAYRQSERGQANLAAYKTSEFRKAAYEKYNNSDKARTAARKYTLSEKGQSIITAYRLSHPEQARAGRAVRYAVSRKLIPSVSTLPCAHCGQKAAGYHHHKGYAREHWFDVLPLCTKCHRRADLAAYSQENT